MAFILQGVPSVPPQPSGTAAAGGGGSCGGVPSDWKAYFGRVGLPAALKILAGLCRGHPGAQALLGERGLLQPLHWMEGTSTSGEVTFMDENVVCGMC